MKNIKNLILSLFVVSALAAGHSRASDIDWHPQAKILSRDWTGTGKVDGMALSGDSCYTNTESQPMADLMVRNAKAKKCPECLHQYRYAEAQVIDNDGNVLKAADMCWTIVTDKGTSEVQTILATDDGKLLIYNFPLQYFKAAKLPRGDLFPTMFPRR